jgi:hypothetical protein
LHGQCEKLLYIHKGKNKTGGNVNWIDKFKPDNSAEKGCYLVILGSISIGILSYLFAWADGLNKPASDLIKFGIFLFVLTSFEWRHLKKYESLSNAKLFLIAFWATLIPLAICLALLIAVVFLIAFLSIFVPDWIVNVAWLCSLLLVGFIGVRLENVLKHWLLKKWRPIMTRPIMTTAAVQDEVGESEF